jgi:hypothetical protein
VGGLGRGYIVNYAVSHRNLVAFEGYCELYRVGNQGKKFGSPENPSP